MKQHWLDNIPFKGGQWGKLDYLVHFMQSLSFSINLSEKMLKTFVLNYGDIYKDFYMLLNAMPQNLKALKLSSNLKLSEC